MPRASGSSGRRDPAEEDALWQREVRDARPLRKRASTPPEGARESAPSAPKQGMVGSKTRPAIGDTHASSGGVDGATERKLRRGLVAVEARLDLHGHTQAEAHAELSAFLMQSQAAGLRCVLVVTGRGDLAGERGVLRRNLPGWLSAPTLRPYVLATASAHARHGGEGARYVLLRRLRRR
jgi:DNA-nicking Smr family endonuclease